MSSNDGGHIKSLGEVSFQEALDWGESATGTRNAVKAAPNVAMTVHPEWSHVLTFTMSCDSCCLAVRGAILEWLLLGYRVMLRDARGGKGAIFGESINMPGRAYRGPDATLLKKGGGTLSNFVSITGEADADAYMAFMDG
jgi:hypothetical protein